MPPVTSRATRPGATPRRWRRLMSCAVALSAMLIASCGIDAQSTTTTTSSEPDNGELNTPTETTEEPVDPDELPDDRYQLFVENVQEWWGTELGDATGTDYDTLSDGAVIDVAETNDLPRCEGEEIPAEAVQGNAVAAPCPEGEVVLYDGEGLFGELEGDYGPIGPGIVLAHEFGHIVQFQANDLDQLESLPTVVLEQQADCFAGAWLNQFLDDPGNDLEAIAATQPLDASIGAILSFRDPVGTSVNAAGAHGSGFDRVRALQEGFDEGTGRCFEYLDDGADGLPLVNLDITEGDLATGGDAPLDDLVDYVVEDLNRYYPEVIDGFDPPTTSDVTSDQAISDALDEYYELGDAAAGTVLALVWADEAQGQVGVETDGDDARLQRACMTGGWLANVILRQREDPEAELRLSPGDLDETISALVELSETERMGNDGAAFELVGALRSGVIDGFDSCDLG